MPPDSAPVPLAEIIGALSLATDAAAGMAPETALRTAVIAVRLARRMGVEAEAASDIFYTALLRFIGCTAYAPEASRVGGGDDLGMLRAMATADTGRPSNVIRTAAGRLNAGRGAAMRVSGVARLLADPSRGKDLARTHCELAVALAPRLGLGDAVVAALGSVYARWDGKGYPEQKRDAIPFAARVVQVAYRAEVHRHIEGEAAAVEVVRQRNGGELDPKVAEAFGDDAQAVLEGLSAPSVWELFAAAEPLPQRRVQPSHLEAVAYAFADFADVKSPFTTGHSRHVERLAVAAAPRLGLSSDAVQTVKIAALLHDLGRCAVPNGIWDKPGPLNDFERDRMQQHVRFTEQVLRTSALLQPYAQLASSDHERCDGSGYARRGSGTALARSERLLAACDVYAALLEARPHRAAMAERDAGQLLASEARAGRLDPECVEAVLSAAGQRDAVRVRGELPAGLSAREVEVLALVARGHSNKQIASELGISAKTVQHHITHIHAKTGVSSRAAAAVFALRHGLTE